jgi:hypothetical protein
MVDEAVLAKKLASIRDAVASHVTRDRDIEPVHRRAERG